MSPNDVIVNGNAPVTGGLDDGDYQWRVRAVDTAANVGEFSAGVTFTWPNGYSTPPPMC